MLYLRGTARDTKTIEPGEGYTDPTYLLTVIDEDGERMTVRATGEAFAQAKPLTELRAKVEVKLDRRRAHRVRGAAWRLTAVAVEQQ